VTNLGWAQKRLRELAAVVAVVGYGAIAAPALAQDGPWTLEAAYVVDAIGPLAGDAPGTGRVLDNLDLVADLDLGEAWGWQGATLHGYLLSNQGGAPNDVAGTLQGVDNIEVGRQGVRLYELWIDARVGARTSLLAGLYDLNSEFYANDASGLLINPSFGIGSELAATGPNGPSIFPSTALALRLNHEFDGGYARVALLNAHAGVPGDPDGVDTEFDHGALLIGEAGVDGGIGSLAIGLWRYTDEQDDIRDITPAGDPVKRTAQGGYLLGERQITGEDAGRGVKGFIRLGFSEGKTSPFTGGWQAGVLVARVFPGRPESTFSVGVQQGLLASRKRDLLATGGISPSRAESGLEITYADRLSPRVSIQPDLQVIFDPGGDGDADALIVAGVRLTIDLSP